MGAQFPIGVAPRGTVPGRSSGVASSEPHPAPTAAGDHAVRPAVARALSALERSGVRWALLRGESELGSRGGDVDVLVARTDLPRLAGELARAGFGRLRRYGRRPHTFFLAYDAGEDGWVKLDVVTELAFGRYQELELGGGAGCLERRRAIRGLAVLTADDGFWTLVLHCLLDGGGFPAAHRTALVALAADASASGPLAQAVDPVLPEGLRADAILRLAKAGDWVTLERAAPFIRARWLGRRRLSGRARALRNRTMRRLGRVPPLCGPGLTIRARPAESGLAAGVAERWPLPHRRLRLHGPLAVRLRSVSLAGWHAARGRLVILELSEEATRSRLERMAGGSDLRALGVSENSPVQEATAELWRRYVERSQG